ncbi:MAG: quinol:electron acceptor oxidoreductase subunit ActD [Vicinamibacterales bacterium]
MSAVYGLFDDPDRAQRAFDRLRRSGIDERAIVVISSEPFEDYAFSRRDHATWMYWIAGGGGAVGLWFAWWLTSTTQRLWPLNTGGMPIVSWMPNAIVLFEMTMLGAILATVATLLVTARLPAFADQIYDAEVSDGYILVGVENPAAGSVDALRQTLEWAGGRVKG